MGLNSSDYGSIVRGLVSSYSPQLGQTVSSLFPSKQPAPQPAQIVYQPAPQPAPFSPEPKATKVIPVGVWIGGGVLLGALVLVLAIKK